MATRNIILQYTSILVYTTEQNTTIAQYYKITTILQQNTIQYYRLENTTDL